MTRANRLTDVFSLVDPDAEHSVGSWIRVLRRHRGLTQEDLAGAVGVSRSAVALWETDRGGEAQKLPAIADILDVPVEFFINGMARREITLKLSPDEASLVQRYRECDAPGQLTLIRTADRLNKKHSRAEKKRNVGNETV
jgi:transcriptional regulator with XRE-family HTH domain